jgi:hypothetical protein
MKYLIRPNTSSLNAAFQSAEILRDDKERGQVPEGLHINRMMPDTDTIIGVLKDQNGKPLINIGPEDLEKAVRSFALTYKDKDQTIRIDEASLLYGEERFWNHHDLRLEIPNIGMELECEGFDSTPINNFWFSVFEKHKFFFIEDGEHERPESMSSVQFIVTPAYLGDGKSVMTSLKESGANLTSTYEVAAAVLNMERETKKYLLDCAQVKYEESFSDKDLDKLIIQCLERSDEFNVFGQRFDNFFVEVSKYNPGQIDVLKVVQSMIKSKQITKTGDHFYYQNEILGYNVREVVAHLTKPVNSALLKKIVKDSKAEATT